jgi:two-component system sensor histidine kinase KdpD
MGKLLTNVLDMAKLQAPHVTLRKEWLPLEEVVGSTLRLLGAALANHPLRLNLPVDLPLVEFDAVLLERVLCNLLENAAKYSPAGAAIDVTAEAKTPWLTVTVSDRGAGFPAEKDGEPFDPFALFVRGLAESSTPGMGLGLAICKAIVDAHGGTIAALARDGGGAEVRFTLPLGLPPAIEEERS